MIETENVRPRNYIDPSLGEGTDKDENVGASDIPESSGAAA
jgi:hypothetical protein